MAIIPDVSAVRKYYQDSMVLHRDALCRVKELPSIDEIACSVRRPLCERVQLIEEDPVYGPRFCIDGLLILRPFNLFPHYRNASVIAAEKIFQEKKEEIEERAVNVSRSAKRSRLTGRTFIALSSALAVAAVTTTSWIAVAAAVATACFGIYFISSASSALRRVESEKKQIDDALAQLKEMDAIPAQIIAEERSERYEKGILFLLKEEENYSQEGYNSFERLLLPQEIQGLYKRYLKEFIEKHSSKSDLKDVASQSEWVKEFVKDHPFSLRMINFSQVHKFIQPEDSFSFGLMINRFEIIEHSVREEDLHGIYAVAKQCMEDMRNLLNRLP